ELGLHLLPLQQGPDVVADLQGVGGWLHAREQSGLSHMSILSCTSCSAVWGVSSPLGWVGLLWAERGRNTPERPRVTARSRRPRACDQTNAGRTRRHGRRRSW